MSDSFGGSDKLDLILILLGLGAVPCGTPELGPIWRLTEPAA